MTNFQENLSWPSIIDARARYRAAARRLRNAAVNNLKHLVLATGVAACSVSGIK